MAWTFFLNITNDTDRDLEVVESQLHWGYWNTNGEEDKEVQVIKAGETAQGVGVKSAFGPNGYEFSCSWKDNNKDKNGENQLPYGVVSVYVDVPHSGSNTASCRANGFFKVEGWESLPKNGHNFIRNIKISTQSPTMDEQSSENAFHKNWSKIEQLDEIKDVKNLELNQYIPKGINFEKLYACRTPVFDIPKNQWDSINDSDFNSLYVKELLIDRYFTVAVTCLKAEAEKIETVSKNGKITTKNEFVLSSSSKWVLETVTSIETAFKFSKEVAVTEKKVVDASLSSKLEYEIKAKFDIKTSSTNEQQTKEVKTKEIIFEAPSDKDMDIVPWAFSKMVLLFRTDKQGVTSLIAASEWDISRVFRSYEYNAMDNTPTAKTIGGNG